MPVPQKLPEIIIGSDEALKGDTFGGIVVAAVKAGPNERKMLQELGVCDSKTLSDKKILLLARKLKLLPHVIISLSPQEYNQHQGSITLLLNDLHTKAALSLKPGFHIVDEYPGCTAGDAHETKAESKYLEVAAASILARAAALRQIEELSQKAGFIIPKGSTHVKIALEQLKQKKLPIKDFVKLNFKNVKDFFNTQSPPTVLS